MGYDELRAERVRKILTLERGISERQMFGGVGFMLDGNMCCGVNQADLIVRVGPDFYEASLSEPHVKLFDMIGRPMRGWVVVESGGITKQEQLETWVGKGVRFARTLPPK